MRRLVLLTLVLAGCDPHRGEVCVRHEERLLMLSCPTQYVCTPIYGDECVQWARRKQP